jgi:hypothetical protein
MKKCTRVVLGYLIVTLLTGCGTLRVIEPDSLPIELAHVSHMTQHEPFTSNPHSYGYNAISVGAKWVPLPNLSISLSEGFVLEQGHVNNTTGVQWHGGLMGTREVFTGRVVYEFKLK